MERGLYVLSGAIVVAAFFWGGIYDSAQSGRGGLYRVNKFTGGVGFCTMNGCEDLPELPPVRAGK